MSHDPRETLNEVLKNIHGSLKWYWQVVMGLSMVKAVDSFYVFLFDGNPPSIIAIVSFLSLFIVFLLVFIRFYFGDSRYLDEHYIEYRKWRPIEEYLEDIPVKISKKRTSLDIGMLMVFGILFVFMAKSLSHSKIFFVTYFILLVFNIIWLQITIDLNVKQQKTQIVQQERYYAPKIWIKNNFVHALLMLPFIWLKFNAIASFIVPVFKASIELGELSTIVLLALCAMNSLIDFKLTSSYYFPDLNKDHDKRLRGN
jgi:hypothetical protein